jgi:hypothetical protein
MEVETSTVVESSWSNSNCDSVPSLLLRLCWKERRSGFSHVLQSSRAILTGRNDDMGYDGRKQLVEMNLQRGKRQRKQEQLKTGL